MSKFRLLSLTVGLCSSVLFAASRDIDSTKLRTAVQKSVDLMQKCGPIFIKNGACTSCHHQSVPAMAIAAARQKGFHVDEGVARQQLQAMAAFMNARRERYLQVIDPGGSADTVGYTLLGMAADKYAPDDITDAMIYYLKATQASDGHWQATAHRPPLEYSSITATATSIRAIQIFAPEEERAEYQKRVQQAAAWLLEAPAQANEERVFRLFGLGWAKADGAAVDKAARELLAGQHADGGWSQFPTLASDAYATGQTLIALHQSGGVPVSDAAYQKGIRFLLNTQLDDGSWLVKTRALPLQPYFESGFPHGPDQWISSTGTAWATMALALAAEPAQLSSRR